MTSFSFLVAAASLLMVAVLGKERRPAIYGFILFWLWLAVEQILAYFLRGTTQIQTLTWVTDLLMVFVIVLVVLSLKRPSDLSNLFLPKTRETITKTTGKFLEGNQFDQALKKVHLERTYNRPCS